METTGNSPNSTLLDGVQQSIRPQDDLYRHVNGSWIDSFEIPSDMPIYGSFYALRDKALEDARGIIEDCASGQLDDPDAHRIATLYSAFMDEDAVESAGIAPLAPLFKAVDDAADRTELALLMGFETRSGVGGLFDFYVDIDRNNVNRYVPYLVQAGISLPDEAYYREDAYAEIREQYLSHLANMLELTGLSQDATADAQRIMDFETAVAKLHWNRVDSRDATRTNNAMSFEQVAKQAPGFDWEAWEQGLQADFAAGGVIVYQPSFFTQAAKLWADADESMLKLWMKWQLALAFAPLLDSELVAEHFDFWSRKLSGAPEQQPRWKRGVGRVEAALGEAVGRLYVQPHFPPQNKAKMEQLVGNLIRAYRDSISNLEWMSPKTRERALEKLEAFTPKIGYPVKWRDYSGLNLDLGNLVEMVRAANRFGSDYQLAKVSGPVDHDEWHMTPQTVNAYYSPTANEIVFPAAILQAPFFDPEAADAINYAGIGAVIGHEIGHGFDDQGSKYDGTGAMNDWWTDADRAEFNKRVQALIEQYNGFSPAELDDSFRVNGALTVGENIGDLGGLSIAWKAWQIALAESGVDSPADAPKVNGLPAAKAFFYSWGRIWRSKVREALAKQLLAVDPHSPNEFRCNGIVANMDEFAQVFDLSEGDALWLDPQERVSIW